MPTIKSRLGQCTLMLGVAMATGCMAVDGMHDEEHTAQVQQAETEFDSCPDTSDVSFERELIITALDVVNDPCRTRWNSACDNPSHIAKWTFGSLMQQMAGTGVNVSTLILKWLESFEELQSVNGQTFIPRSSIRSMVIDPWRQISKKPDGTPCSLGVKVDASPCNLDLTKAPFRLLAIVNRTDLRAPGYGGGAGEGRFVFGFTKMDGTPLEGTVILEYALPTTITPVQWAGKFHSLASRSPGEQYNSALTDITQLFTKTNANTANPNGSAISQVRTAEKSFDPSGSNIFEMREQRLQCRPNTICTQYNKLLLPSTLVLTPRNNIDSSSALTSYMNNNMSAILNGNHVVPTSMLAAYSRPIDIATNPFRVWMPDAPLNSVPPPNTEGDVRRLFGFSTCNGCHSEAETNTKNFQIFPRASNAQSELSPFLLGETSINEALEDDSVKYNERERRKCEFKRLYLGNTNLLTTNAGRSH